MPEPITVEIRPWAAGDLDLLERLMGDPAMTAHLGGPESPEEIRARHERYCRDLDEGKDHTFAVLVGSERAPAGWVGYWEAEWAGEPVWEMGWSMLPEFQGMGIATRAAGIIVTLARAERKFRYIHAFPAVGNGPSNAVCRKLGLENLGAVEVEYPKGVMMHSNNWRLDLFASV